jgi:signal peptidase I
MWLVEQEAHLFRGGWMSPTVSILFSLGLFSTQFLYLTIALTWLVAIGVHLKIVSSYHLAASSGKSMMPSIPLGLSFELSKSNFDSVEAGDIISYELNGDNIMHRIIEVKEDGGYVAKGDWNENPDPIKITDEMINAKVVQCGRQPIYVPISPFAIIFTAIKIYKSIQKH